MTNPHESKGWQVVIAGTGINLALGVLYAWSVFKEAIVGSIKAGGPGAFQWELASVGTPYAVSCLVFAFAMILAGKLQDKIGPARTALIGGLLVGAGFVLLGFTTSYLGWIIGFGVLAGAGLVLAIPLQPLRPLSGSPRPRPAWWPVSWWPVSGLRRFILPLWPNFCWGILVFRTPCCF